MVETIMAALVGALASGAKDGLTDVAKKGVSDGYEKLKSAIKRHSVTGDVADALEKVEAKPDSEPRRAVLAEELQGSRIGANDEVIAQANSLLNLVRALPGNNMGGQVAHGTGIAQADRSSVASVTMTGDRN
ncbi:hypothetical protein [Granulicella mallensis]|uniref:Uncharacterized protein n=1 Tax=Granulicella mallensis TaxID=940614 RepID=A0A7W7ZM10_9BACT|nr:hypothetical protein [Granulicella mallensis]MBB5062054.1 hypothetical protein [Granulicella mallensis]